MAYATKVAALVLTGLLALPAHAEMLEFATPQGTKSWPKLPTLTDWHQDLEVSMRQGANVLVPDGYDHASAGAVISAEGLSRQNGGQISTLLDRDKAAAPGAAVTPLPELRDKDGAPFQLYSFARPDGRWQVAAYNEEGEFLLTFRLTATSQAAGESALPIFTGMIRKYAKDIPW